MDIVICAYFQLIPCTLSYEMAAVACRIDQNILRFAFQSTLDHGFQIFIFNLKFFERKIIHVDNKFVIAVFDLGNNLIQIYKLMLIYFDDSQSLIIILIQDTFDAGRFTCSCITEQQTVICLSSTYKCLCIFDEFLFWYLIADQIIQTYMCDPGHRYDHCPAVLIMVNAECFVKSEFSYTEVFVKLDHVCHKFFSIFGNCQCFAHLTDTVTDTFVKHFAGILRCFIITEDSTAGCMEQFVQHCQIKVIEFFKNRKIMKCKLIDTAFDCTSDLARSTECIFMIYKKKCKIIVPQISRKSIRTCNFDQTVDAFIKFFFHLACIDC